MGTLIAGATLIPLRRFRVSQFWAHVQHYQAMQFNFIGAMARMLYNQPSSPFEASHRVRLACGAPMPAEIYEDFEPRFHRNLPAAGQQPCCPWPPCPLLV